jgi:hypothetical protein
MRFDPEISEWGNLAPLVRCRLFLKPLATNRLLVGKLGKSTRNPVK